jgi:uncharacterized protein (DUF488 family)
MSNPVYTIGHSSHSIEKLIELLALHEISAVADVRSQPFSRLHSQFNRDQLEPALKKSHIAYVFLGRELGARTEDRSCYVDGKVQYDRLAKTAPFQEGLARVAAGAGRRRLTLLCAEKDPLTCHRAILVCRHLESNGVQSQHILADGSIETHEQAVVRLIGEVGLAENDLFRTREQIIADAYDRRGSEIAYTETQGAAPDPLGVMPP